MAGRRLASLAQQRARQRELDLIRLERPLTRDEAAEADRIAAREQMRAWRHCQRERELALARPAQDAA